MNHHDNDFSTRDHRSCPRTQSHPLVGVWLSVVLLVVGLGAGFLVGRVTKADPPADLASTSAVTLMNDFARAVNMGDAKAIAALFTEDAVSVGPGQKAEPTTELVGAQRIADSLASLSDLGLRITDPGTAVQGGTWVSQPVNIVDTTGFILVQVIDNKIDYQVMLWHAP